MRTPNRLAQSLTLVLALGALAAGCGGSSNAKSSKPAAPAADTGAQAVQQDVTAKSAARTSVTEMEACYVDAQTYSSCQPTTAGAQVTAATDLGYTITAKSASGSSFAIAKADDGSLARTCTPAGKGGCAAGGSW